MENVVDSGATLAFPRDLIDEIAFDHFGVTVDKQIDDMYNHGTLILTEINIVQLKSKQFSFIFEQLDVYLFVQRWDALLDVSNQDLVQ